MRILDSSATLTRELGKICLGGRTIQEQLDNGLALLEDDYYRQLLDPARAREWCRQTGLNDGEDLLSVMRIARAVADSQDRGSSGYMVHMDTRQSGILLLSLGMKDQTALACIGLLDNTPSDVYSALAEASGGLTRDEMKKAVVPYNYGGVAEARKILGPGRADLFFRVYRDMLPCPDCFRAACLEAWDPTARSYRWTLPDHLEVVQVVENFDRSVSASVYWEDETGRRNSVKVCPNLPGCLPRGSEGTRGIGANLTHSLDAYILRELVRRCGRNQTYRRRFSTLVPVPDGSDRVSFSSSRAADIFSSYRATGMASLRILEFTEDGDCLPRKYHQALGEAVRALPDSEFDVVTVHDEFMCRFDHAQDLRNCFSRLMLELYRGSLFSYFAGVFGMDLLMGTPAPAMEERILEYDYFLS